MTSGAWCPLALAVLRRIGPLALLSSFIACAASRPPAANAGPTEVAIILREASFSCQPPLAATNPGEQWSEVFVETLLFDVPLSTQVGVAGISQLARQSDVHLLGTPHVVGKLAAQTTLSLEQRLGVLEQPTLTRFSLLPQRSESGLHVLEFELGFSMPNADPARNPELARSSFLVEGQSDRAMLGSAAYPGNPQRKVLAVVKAHPIRHAEDLRALFECKMQQRRRALQQP
jgi:hypothetical protein